ncbi:MAG: OsmC family protein [Bacteroidetes bacterium]|nr:OsmC family protein [Bacteroidota bacterium]
MPQLKVKTDYLGNYQSKTENTFSDTPIIVDAMKFTPLDLLSSAYNSCMLGTMEYIAKQNEFEIGQAKSEIEWALSEDTTRIGSMDIKISFANDFSEEQKEILENAAQTKCHVGQTLNPAIEKKFTFNYKSN